VHAGYTEGKAALKDKQYELAIKEFTSSVNTGDKLNLFYLGFANHKLGKLKEAWKWYKKSAGKDVPIAFYNLSIIADEFGNSEDAAILFLSYIDLIGVDKLSIKEQGIFYDRMVNTNRDSKYYQEMQLVDQEIVRNFSSISDDRDGRKWNISGGDFNFDGKFSITDLWVGFTWIFFYLGDWIHFHMLYTFPFGFSQFLELDVTFYSGWLSGITSLYIYLIVFPSIIVEVINVRSFYKNPK